MTAAAIDQLMRHCICTATDKPSTASTLCPSLTSAIHLTSSCLLITNRLIVIRLQTVRTLPIQLSISKPTSGMKAHSISLSTAKRFPTNSHRDRDPHRCKLPLPSTKWVWPPSCARTLFEQYKNLTLVDHTTKSSSYNCNL